MARWTQDVYLMHKNGGSYEKLIDIKEYPDLGAEPEQIESTTMSATKTKSYIAGLQDSAALQFLANYSKEEYAALQEIHDAGDSSFALFFGVAGADGKFYWNGTLDAWLTGKGVNEVAEITISITPSTGIGTQEPA